MARRRVRKSRSKACSMKNWGPGKTRICVCGGKYAKKNRCR